MEHAIACQGLGRVLFRLGEEEEADRLMQRSLTLLEENLRPGHPNLAIIRGLYADMLREMGRDEEADLLAARNEAETAR
jgi:hypothetical protein